MFSGKKVVLTYCIAIFQSFANRLKHMQLKANI